MRLIIILKKERETEDEKMKEREERMRKCSHQFVSESFYALVNGV